MLNLKPLGTDVEKIRKFMEISPIAFCDLSVGVKYMWRDNFVISYDVIDDTLIMAESCIDYDFAFYYPIGKNVDVAFCEMENYCKEKGVTFRLCCVDDAHVIKIKEKYPNVDVYNIRAWSDYIYDTESFCAFAGRKYGGQRNHVNKFKKLYPNYVFRPLEKEDLPEIKLFIKEFERLNNISLWTAKEEEKKVLEFAEKSFELKQDGGLILVGGKIIAFSIGERVGDTYIVHVEKALSGYEGAYPTIAQEFARKYAKGTKYINREEDCGDEGLRISKTQYHPVIIKNKNIVVIKTLFDKLPTEFYLKTQRLEVTEIKEKDMAEYFRLYTDENLNKYWGYDYREDLVGEPTKEWFYDFQNKLKLKQEEYSFAVRLDGKMIGELVLHNFGYDGSLEIGHRFFYEAQGKGYAYESACALLDYVTENYSPTEIKSRCFKENLPSKKLIEKLGLTKASEDNQKYYFSKKIK